MPLWVIKYLLPVVALVALVSGIWYHGYRTAEREFEQDALDQALANSELVAEIVRQTEDETRLLYEAEIKRLKRKPLPDTCVLSGEFRQLHDDAAGMPKASQERGAAPDTVTPQDLADTIATNYFRCQQNIIWLNECQNFSHKTR